MHSGAAVKTVWARGLPPSLLEAWWADGAYEPVYRAVEAMKDAARLAWFSGLDPYPAGPRAMAAARRALRLAGERDGLVPVVAAIPLAAAPVRAAAEKAVTRGAERGAALLLELRTATAVEPRLRVELDGFLARRDDRDVSVFGAVGSRWLASCGETAAANELLATTVGQASTSDVFGGVFLDAVCALGAWASVPVMLQQQAAFLAALMGDERALALAVAQGWPLATAALVKPEVPAAWREQLLRSTLEERQRLWEEGLLSDDELFADRLGRAACAADRRAQLDLLTLEAMATAQKKAADRAGVFSLRRRREAQTIARLSARLKPALDEATTTGQVARAYAVVRLVTQLARAGGRAEARDALAVLETALRASGTRWWTGDLFASAEGRSLEAEALLDEYSTLESRVLATAALAFDGHLARAAEHLNALLDEPLAVEHLEVLAPAVGLLDPPFVEDGEVELAALVSALPGATVEQSRGWLTLR